MMNRLLLLLSIISSLLHAEVAPPILKYPEGMTWKGVFDAGFRPKLMGGNLSRSSAEILDQEYVLHFKDREPFYTEKGRLKFDLLNDDSIYMVSLAGRKHLTIEEAQNKIDLFHKIFDGYITTRGILPPIIDKKRGSVMRAGQQGASARTDQHNFSLGFRGSYNLAKPYVMSFIISQRVPKGNRNLFIRQETVKPPEGYEWFDMTPISNISPERQKRIDEILRSQKLNQQESEQASSIVREPKPLSNTEPKPDKPRTFPWWLMGITGLIVVLGFILLKGK